MQGGGEKGEGKKVRKKRRPRDCLVDEKGASNKIQNEEGNKKEGEGKADKNKKNSCIDVVQICGKEKRHRTES